MTLSDAFAAATGTWSGSSRFRMMPSDPFSTAPATGTLTLAAGGSLVSFAYTWSHPVDGDQDGLLVAGPDDSGGLVALWADSWHQQPAPMSMTGSIDDDGALLVTGSYAGEWGWRIALSARRLAHDADGKRRPGERRGRGRRRPVHGHARGARPLDLSRTRDGP